MDTWSIRKTKPIQSQSKPIQSQLKPIKANKMPKQSQFKPKQTQFFQVNRAERAVNVTCALITNIQSNLHISLG
ncbi:MAG: hypothetical protein WBC22_19555, partial [Sedimentisphaerales bacterium]